MTPKEEMFDPQWLDMQYEKYYFIPWPDSQYYDDVDDDADDGGQCDGEGEGAQNEVDALPVVRQQPLRFPPSSHLRPLHAVTGFS